MTKSLIERLENLTTVGLQMISCNIGSVCHVPEKERTECKYKICYTPNSSYPCYAYSGKKHTFEICILEAKRMYGGTRK